MLKSLRTWESSKFPRYYPTIMKHINTPLILTTTKACLIFKSKMNESQIMAIYVKLDKKSCCCWISHFIENGVAYSFYVRTRKFDFRPSVLIFQRWPRLKMFLLSSCLKFELSPSFAACALSKMIFIESNKFSALASKLCNT